jgi:hypothetical protein
LSLHRFTLVILYVNWQEKAQTVEPVQVSAVVEPDSAAKASAPGSEHKRKLSVDQDAAASKKPRGEDNPPTEPKRYDTFLAKTDCRNREHATILASNFPQGISDDQVRHFFKEVLHFPTDVVDDSVVRLSNLREPEMKETKESLLSLNLKTRFIFSRSRPLMLLGRGRIRDDETFKEVSRSRNLGQ